MRPPSSPPPSDQRWRVVIIDDSEDDRAEAKRLLRVGSSRRYDFVEAADLAPGVEAVLGLATPPDCVVVDYHLPGGSGAEVVAALLGPEGQSVCPVVMVTGDDDCELGRQMLRAGAQDFIGKGWMTAESMTRAVENAVERWHVEKELRLALEDAQRALIVRDQIVALVSHDLRNPLSAILMAASLMAGQVHGPAQGLLERIERQARRMSKLIDELLDVSQMQQDRELDLQLQEVDLGALVRELCAEHQQTSPKHLIEADTGSAPLVGQWDMARLQRVIANLLSNAVKYSPKGGTVRVTVESARAGDAPGAVLRISDEGIGIPEKELGTIFEWFSRAANATRAHIPGIGIGLAGARKIVERHGGSVSVASEERRGSTFTVRLPLRPPARVASPAAASSRSLLDVAGESDTTRFSMKGD